MVVARARRPRQITQKRHAARLVGPWYDATQHAAVHQYLDDDFVDRFQDDLTQGRLGLDERTAWRQRDFFGGYRDHVSLRQPVHGAFHLVSAQVVCDQLGEPAFDPGRVRSGCVAVRRRIDGVPHGWLVASGVALGWRPVDPALDPRVPRISARDGGVMATEDTSPLHVTEARDASGRRRSILYGYMPVSGGAVRRQLPGRPMASAPGLAALRNGVLSELPKPIGSGSGPGARSGSTQLVLDRGRPSSALLTLLRLAIERHHVGLEESEGEVAALKPIRDVLERWHFDHPVLGQNGGDVASRSRRPSERSVLSWIIAELAPRRLPAQESEPLQDPELRPLLRALAHARQVEDALHSVPEWAQVELPDGAGNLSLNLHAEPALMSELADALAARTVDRITALAREVPIPRFAFGDADVYHGALYARWLGEGCEHTTACLETPSFRVAPPYSGEAARPTAIQLPGLKDLRRGLPTHGFVAPAELAKKMLGIRGKFPDLVEGDGFSLGLCWWFGFSIPAITICAFVLLFIIIFVLNLVFWWLPWVMLRLPFFCKRD